jgi:hypothetical protein
MPVIMKLGLISGLDRLINDKPQLRQNIDDLVFASRADLKDIDWSKAKVFVPSDPTAITWISKAVAEINEFLRNQPNATKPSIAYLGGNNGKYKNMNSLETKLAAQLCKFNDYSLYPFIKGVESEIISKQVGYRVRNQVFKSVELEKESGNSKQNWENALKQGLLNGVETIVVVGSQEGVARHIGTLKATLKAHGLATKGFNIVAYPYTATISSENLKLYQKNFGIKFPVPNSPVSCCKGNWNKSAWGIYRTFMELLAIKRYSAKGDVYLTDEQKQILKKVFDEINVKTVTAAIIKAKVLQNPKVQDLIRWYKSRSK